MKRRSELLSSVQEAGKELFRAVDSARKRKADNTVVSHETDATKAESSTMVRDVSLAGVPDVAPSSLQPLGMVWSSIGKGDLGRREWVDGAGPALRNTLRASLGQMPGMFAKGKPGKQREVSLNPEELAGLGISCGGFQIDWERFGRTSSGAPFEPQKVSPVPVMTTIRPLVPKTYHRFGFLSPAL